MRLLHFPKFEPEHTHVRSMNLRIILRVVTLIGLLAPLAFVYTAYAQLPVEPFPCPIDRAESGGHCPLPPWVDSPAQVQQVTVERYQVDALVERMIATVQITEVLHNSGGRVAEGVYLFPLPADASASSLTLEIDGEVVEGELYAAGEARSIYTEIVRSVRDPALLEWVESGLFRISVFPILPGESRTVQLRYEQPVGLQNGLNTLAIPLKAYATGASTPEQMLINVELADQYGLRTLYSPSHDVAVERKGDTGALIGFEGRGAASQSEFTLYWGTDEQSIGINLISYKPTDEDGYLLAMLAPSLDAATDEIVARDLVIVLDVSGSMQGDKITQARAAVAYVVSQLNPGDRFNLITFSTGVKIWQRTLQEVDEANIAEASEWIGSIRATGSTDINRALLEAIAQLAGGDSERPAYVLFMTDGLPTQGETAIGNIVDNALDATPIGRSLRLFTFGVGYDVNTDLLGTLSSDLGGRSTYVKPDQSIDEVVGDFYTQIGKPVLANVHLDFGDATVVDELYPSPLPDLFAGEQVLVVGRYRAGGFQTITLSGEVNGRTHTYVFPGQELAESGGEPAVARLWATRKMGVLLDQVRREGASQELVDAVVELSLAYGIVSPFTSYLVLEPDANESAQTGANATTGGMVGLTAANAAPAINAYDMASARLRESASADASGADAVAAAEERNQLANATSVRQQENVRYVAGKTFVQRGWVESSDGGAVPFWVDTAWDGSSEPELITFGSEAYFALLGDPQQPEMLHEWLAVATDMVIVLDGGRIVRITSGDAQE